MKQKGFLPLKMDWDDLVFLNYPCDPEILQKFLPEGMEVDLFENRAYLTIAPLTMSDFSLYSFKFLFQKRFYECNLRTYVKVGKKRGVYFFSLDANSVLEVLGARAVFHLNYRYRSIKFKLEDGRYRFEMKNPISPNQKTLIILGISHQKQELTPLIRFISDRSSYFVKNKNHLFEGVVKHKEWEFQKVEVLKVETDLLNRFPIVDPPVAVYSKKTTVESRFLCPAQNPIVFFDHACGLCQRAVAILLALDIRKQVLFAPINGKTYKTIFSHPPKNDRLILFDDQGASDGAKALLNLLDYLPWFTGIFSLFRLVPLSLLNRWYDAIAKMRKSCDLEKKRLDDPRILP
ncbi:MAG: DUF2071 domain-containing protein [Verrucomicrobia bacterium]|nr:DUF2071 domain-containing protein [Verrucomicrobiota bacterium]